MTTRAGRQTAVVAWPRQRHACSARCMRCPTACCCSLHWQTYMKPRGMLQQQSRWVNVYRPVHWLGTPILSTVIRELASQRGWTNDDPLQVACASVVWSPCVLITSMGSVHAVGCCRVAGSGRLAWYGGVGFWQWDVWEMASGRADLIDHQASLTAKLECGGGQRVSGLRHRPTTASVQSECLHPDLHGLCPCGASCSRIPNVMGCGRNLAPQINLAPHLLAPLATSKPCVSHSVTEHALSTIFASLLSPLASLLPCSLYRCCHCWTDRIG